MLKSVYADKFISLKLIINDMSVCELCGRSSILVRALVEGTELSVCEPCGRFGQVIKKPVVLSRKLPVALSGAPVKVVVADYARIIRKAREKKGITQKDFARMINEKESLIHKIETGSFTPAIDLAQKLERYLKIALVEIEKESELSSKTKSAGPFGF